MKRSIRFLAVLALLALAGCGPLLDLRNAAQDAVGPPRVGPMTPHGQIKHDFWGRKYIEPYRHVPRESSAPDQDSK